MTNRLLLKAVTADQEGMMCKKVDLKRSERRRNQIKTFGGKKQREKGSADN